MRLRRPSPAMLVALLALFIALGGPAQAERTVGLVSSAIKRGSVGTKQIKDYSIRFNDLTGETVRQLRRTPRGSVGPRQLAPLAVSTPALAPSAVGSAQIADGSITAAELAPKSVGDPEISDNAIGQAQIRTNGIGADELAPESVDSEAVSDGGLRAADIARKTGVFRWTVPALAPNECAMAWVPMTGGGAAGDFVLVSPRTPWPRELVYFPNSTGSDNEFKIVVCNRSKSVEIGSVTHSFSFAAIGG